MKVFGSVARALREDARLTVEDVALGIEYSVSMVHKIERGERMPPPKYMDFAVQFDRRGILRRAEQFLSRSEYPLWAEDYAELERTALRLSSYDCVGIPPLLQTEDYARATVIGASAVLDSEEIESRVRFRIDRQDLLTRTPLCQLDFLIEERVLRHTIGSRDVQVTQLAHLQVAGHLRHVTIRVLSSACDVHPGSGGPMTVLETADRHLVGYLEVHGRGTLLYARDQAGDLGQSYASIGAQALSVRDSRKLIEQIAKEL